MKFIIKGNPISKKNSQQIYINKKTGRPFVTASSQYKRYEELCLYQIKRPQSPIDYPVNVKCVYYMEKRYKVDLVNLQEATLDILVRAGVLEDDNFKIVQSMDGSYVDYDKTNPRVEIEIMEVA